MKQLTNNWIFVVAMCLTLGLSPFRPEPHLWGKIKWIAGGAKGMQLQDWFDVIIHGLPFILLIRLLILPVLKTKKTN